MTKSARDKAEEQLWHCQKVLDAAKEAVAMAQQSYHEAWVQLQDLKRRGENVKLVKDGPACHLCDDLYFHGPGLTCPYQQLIQGKELAKDD